jgi:hypothetical protein
MMGRLDDVFEPWKENKPQGEPTVSEYANTLKSQSKSLLDLAKDTQKDIHDKVEKQQIKEEQELAEGKKVQSKKKLFQALSRISPKYKEAPTKEFKHAGLSNEVYGRDARVYVYWDSPEERKKMEAELSKQGFHVNTGYSSGGKTSEIKVSYFKGWHRNESEEKDGDVLNEGQEFEIKGANNKDRNLQKMINRDWTAATYKGDNIFKMYMKGLDDIENALEAEYDGYNGQESYLGYSPSKDRFVSGWDSARVSDYDDDDSYYPGSNEESFGGFVEFSFYKNKVIVHKVFGHGSSVYMSGINAIRKHYYKDIIDLRLD